MRLLTILLIPLPALAGLPGEGEPVTTVDVRATTDPDTRLPAFVGLGASVALPLDQDEAIPDLELGGDLQLNQVPPKDFSAWMEENGGPQDVRYARLRSRLSAQLSWGATSRESGLRLRVGPELLIEGDAGSKKHFGGQTEWGTLHTLSARAGFTGAFGLAVPLGADLDDPLIDMRLGASILAPVHASGGLLATERRDELLTVDDMRFRPSQTLGRETRVWGEGTVSVDHLRLGLRMGLHHRARDARLQALADSPNHEVLDTPVPVAFLAQIRAGVVF